MAEPALEVSKQHLKPQKKDLALVLVNFVLGGDSGHQALPNHNTKIQSLKSPSRQMVPSCLEMTTWALNEQSPAEVKSR